MSRSLSSNLLFHLHFGQEVLAITENGRNCSDAPRLEPRKQAAANPKSTGKEDAPIGIASNHCPEQRANARG
jgi:hypothetical protein